MLTKPLMFVYVQYTCTLYTYTFRLLRSGGLARIRDSCWSSVALVSLCQMALTWSSGYWSFTINLYEFVNIVLLTPWTGELSLLWLEVPPVCRLAGGLALWVCWRTPIPLVSLDLFLGATMELFGLLTCTDQDLAWTETVCYKACKCT